MFTCQVELKTSAKSPAPHPEVRSPAVNKEALQQAGLDPWRMSDLHGTILGFCMILHHVYIYININIYIYMHVCIMNHIGGASEILGCALWFLLVKPMVSCYFVPVISADYHHP